MSDDWSKPPQNNEGWGTPDPQQDPQPWDEPSPPPQSGPPIDDNWGQPAQPPNQQMVKSGKKPFPKLETNDIIVLVLSFFIPGAGHLMLGQTAKGLVILAAIIFTCGMGYIATIAIVADAFFCLVKKKETGHLEDWELFPNYNDYL